MKKTFKIVRCHESTQNAGTFYTKLVREIEVNTIFGIKRAKETYYVKGTKQMIVDEVVEIDMNIFRVEEHQSQFADEQTGEMLTRNLKWLHLRTAA